MVNQRLLARARARKRSRGAALFVVLVVIVMLTGLGIFTTRSAMLTTTTSGAARQMTQTHYVTEYALGLTVGELSSARKEAYVRSAALTPDPLCYTPLPNSNVQNPVPNATCYRFGYADLKKQVQASQGLAATGDLLEPAIPNPSNPSGGVPGSLGYADLQGSFLVEMTDIAPASPPVAGMDMASTSIQFYAVTLTAVGQVRPRSSVVNAVDPSTATAAGFDTLRSHVVVGPLPKM